MLIESDEEEQEERRVLSRVADWALRLVLFITILLTQLSIQS
jgi:hypothetical protein